MAEDTDARADAFASAYAEVRADPAIQFELGETPIPQAARPPVWAEWLANGFEAALPVLRVLFWVGVAVVAAIVLWMIVREARARLAARAAPEGPSAPAQAYRPNETEARALLADADRLAAEGRFAEAARALLHRSVAAIEKAHPRLIGRAATSREIARLEPLSPLGRDSFARIAEIVERGHFAGRAVGAEDFALCRSAYEAFAFEGRV